MATLADRKRPGTAKSPSLLLRPPPRKQFQSAFDDLLKAARALCKDLNLPVTSASNPILARIAALTNTALGGPFPPALLTLSSPSITASHLRLLLRLLTSRAGLSYQAAFTVDRPLYAGLRNLQLWACPITDAGVSHLVDALPGLPSITSLTLFHCALPPSSCAHLARYLSGYAGASSSSSCLGKRSAVHLRALTLDHNPIGDAGLALLAPALPSSPVARLSLSWCGLTASASSSLPAMLASSSLTSLSLEGNAVTSAALPALTAALSSSSSSLRELCMRNVSLYALHEAAPSFAAFISAIPARPFRLDLDVSILGDAAMKAAVEAARKGWLIECEVSAMEDVALYKELRTVVRGNRERLEADDNSRAKVRRKSSTKKKKKR